ncbi:MAG: D-tyrosyl-tRNA(Tyr) deacylase [Methylococcales bacterium]|jgi:D-tyrosyl-tRNA(Tyr) deacylase|nr:D-tyrosyl-tRNA(Tyr) deacylase [Methylococcales bacterium]MBT7408456.1 D-tyrosyl-tRNA(Tyr) deacylase [Methylococcales bacterium]
MIALIQRVNHATVEINQKSVGNIGKGILALIGVQKQDDELKALKLFKKIINYRIFADDQDKMNHSLLDINGELLLVPQFTLAANTQKGARPSFSSAALPEMGEKLFKYLVNIAGNDVPNVQTGIFGADMQVSLLNDGPVTFWLEV